MLRNLQLCTRRSICENYCIKSFKAVEKRENNNSKIDCNLWSHHFSEHFSAIKLYLCRTDLHPRHVFLLEDKVKARAFFLHIPFLQYGNFLRKNMARSGFRGDFISFYENFPTCRKVEILNTKLLFPTVVENF